MSDQDRPRQNDVHEPQDTLRAPSRRAFLRLSLAGAGAVAFPGASSASRHGKAEESCPRDELWFQPWEWVTWEHEGDSLPLVVNEATNIHILRRVNERADACVSTLAEYCHRRPGWLAGTDLCRDVEPGEATAPCCARGPKLSESTQLFAYNGVVPGPTVRMRGDDVLGVRLFNVLTGNDGTFANAKGTRFITDARVPGLGPYRANDPVPAVEDWMLAESMLAGPHEQHTTNFHTHGLHVSPRPNADNGTQSDFVMLRVLPADDQVKRLAHNPPIPLEAREFVGDVSYEFRLGKSSGPRVETHYPGTHWYHPHPHGATFDQVATGMAGLLIVEGETDWAINQALTGRRHPDPARKTGPYGYRERQILIQRVVAGGNDVTHQAVGSDPESERGPGSGARPVVENVNGQAPGTLRFDMRVGDVERWRVLNGSVDGQGYVRFMVGRGRPPTPPPEPCEGACASVVEQFIEDSDAYDEEFAKWRAASLADLHLLAFDGINLVRPQGEGRYHLQPLADGFHNYLVLSPANRADFMFQPRQAGTYTVLAEYVRDAVDTAKLPFHAPPAVHVATICVRERPGDLEPIEPLVEKLAPVLASLPVQGLLQPIADRELDTAIFQWNRDDAGVAESGKKRRRHLYYTGWGARSYKIVNPVATFGLLVSGKPAAGRELTALDCRAYVEGFYYNERGKAKSALGRPSEALAGAITAAKKSLSKKGCSRQLTVEVAALPQLGILVSQADCTDPACSAFVEDCYFDTQEAATAALGNPKVKKAIAAVEASLAKRHCKGPFVPAPAPLPDAPKNWQVQNFTQPNSMNIDGRKFDAGFIFHTMGLGTAEEWTLDNYSMSISIDPAAPAERKNLRFGLAGQREQEANLTTFVTSSVDHPFHMHQNAFWVTAVYAADGTPLDWNHEPLAPGEAFPPRWQDTVRIPRNGGRVVFRSRFWDYTGMFVNHCHLLNHEDYGMMQTVGVVPDPADADFVTDPRAIPRQLENYVLPSPEETRKLPPEQRKEIEKKRQANERAYREMYWACMVLTSPKQPQAPSRHEVFCNGEATPLKVDGSLPDGCPTAYGQLFDPLKRYGNPAVSPPAGGARKASR